mgnify:CR=1 FL=1
MKSTEEGGLVDSLGVQIDKSNDNACHLHQRHPVDSITSDSNLKEDTRPRPVPCKVSEVLKRDSEGDSHDDSFDHRSATGKLTHTQ